jgi:phosphomevalonate kinase
VLIYCLQGLGSSAGLVVSLVAGLLGHFGVDDKEVQHNLAQLCHCLAQKGIGSGYDISSVFHGTGVYTRFSPAMITDVLGADFAGKARDLTSESIGACVEKQWDYKFEQLEWPAGFDVLLGDVAQGSATTGLVRKLSQWREDNRQAADILWNRLVRANRIVIDAFLSIGRSKDGAEPSQLQRLSAHMKTMRTAFAALGFPPSFFYIYCLHSSPWPH